MNILKIDNRYYKYESFWSREGCRNDTNEKPFPRPKSRREKWYNLNEFLEKLEQVETFVRNKNNYEKYDKAHFVDCLICNEKDVGRGLYTLNRVRWEDSLYHYVKEHFIEPTEEFQDIIFNFKQFNLVKTELKRFNSTVVTTKDKMMLKLDRNQINIMDALMEHGGYTKKYYDEKDRSFRYSEHAGLLDFDLKGLNKILIYGTTERVSKYDNEIYLPITLKDSYDYEYIFHTHPPTPKPGGRTMLGVMYEFPSISDIFHFIEHYNNGATQGSVVIAPEGLYNVRKKHFDKEKIIIDKQTFLEDVRKAFVEIQGDAINRFGDNIDATEFYETVAQDTSYIDRFNTILNKYDINIDYYPRKKIKDRWMIDTIYLPVYPKFIEN